MNYRKKKIVLKRINEVYSKAQQLLLLYREELPDAEVRDAMEGVRELFYEIIIEDIRQDALAREASKN